MNLRNLSVGNRAPFSSRGKAVRGFTVIETLVALTLLAAGAGFLLATLGASSRLVRDVRENETALWLARSRLVEAAAYPDRPPPEDDGADRYEGVDYRTRIEYREISPVPDIEVDKLAPALRLIEIRVLVSWGALPSQVQLTTYRKAVRDASPAPAPRP